jgi:GNAT superfamily N-acetyltransferase
MPWSHGTHVLTQRMMGQRAEQFRGAAPVAGVVVRAAGPRDLESAVDADVTAFGGDAETVRRWLSPLLTDPAVTLALAEDELGTVAIAYTVSSDGAAGPAVFLAGVGVAPRARRRGIGGLVSSWLLGRAYSAGSRLGHLQPDTDEAARVYARLGFVETTGLDVYVDDYPGG